MCIRCGRDRELVDGKLCIDCYRELYGFGVAPVALKVVQCPRCGSYKFQGRWYPAPDETQEAIIAAIFQASFQPRQEIEYYRVEDVSTSHLQDNGLYAKIRLVAKPKLLDKEYSMDYLIPLRVDYQLCPSCFRKAAKVPQAIIQIRSWKGRLSRDEKEVVEDLLASVGKELAESIIEVEERREGIDLKLTDQHVARSIAAKLRATLGARVIESHTVVGRRSDGKPRTRLTLSVRIPFFQPGTIADLNGDLVVVESISNGRVQFRRLGSRKRRSLKIEHAWEQLSHPSGAEALYGLISAIEPGWIHVQVLEPNYDYLELPLNQTRVEVNLVPGIEVVVLKYNNKYYLIPRAMWEHSSQML